MPFPWIFIIFMVPIIMIVIGAIVFYKAAKICLEEQKKELREQKRKK